MDIARPDIRQKKMRWRAALLGTALIAVSAALLIWRLELRHHRKYVTLTRNGHPLELLVDLPVRPREKPLVVVLVHEIYGLSDWAEGMADELADQGFIVVAPDMLSSHGPKGGGYSDFSSESDVRQAISDLDPNEVTADLDTASDYAKTLTASGGKIAIVGFSWGGWKSFAFATHRKDLSGTFVFYGTGPSDVSAISAPVYGFYGGNDGAVDSTVSGTADAMKAAGKFYEPVTYEGADHGFMRVGEELGIANSANKSAHNQAFARLVNLLKKVEALI